MIDTFHLEHFDIFNVAAVTPQIEIANPLKNVELILHDLSSPDLLGAAFIVFPELCISGYTCADLFFQESLIQKSYEGLQILCDSLKDDGRLIVVGLPVRFAGRLYNCAAVMTGGRILGIVPKIHIPNYQEFYEKRWFSSGADIKDAVVNIIGYEVPFGVNFIFSHLGVKVAIEICEDLWVPVPPSSHLVRYGAELILNLSATDDNIGKFSYINGLVSSQSARCRCVYAYASAGMGESSTDLIFSGIDLIGYDGEIKASSERFIHVDGKYAIACVDFEKLRNDRRKYSTFYDEALRDNSELNIRIIHSEISPKLGTQTNISIDPTPFVPASESSLDADCSEIVEIQSWGLSQRLKVTNCCNLVVGISGGLDSTLALLIAHHTFAKLGYDMKDIWGITMPSVATSDRTHTNALELMRCLGVTFKEIPIKEAVDLHFENIGHNSKVHDIVYENSQARERTQILMDLANKCNGLVLGTGDMSELALGWCTYNGDHMAMYNINSGVPKTLVIHLVRWFARNTLSASLQKVLLDIIDTPISPELVPGDNNSGISQKTEEIVGPYELHDFFLYHVIRNGFTPKKILFLALNAFSGKYDKEMIKKWMDIFYRRFFTQQFKRSCMPDGPKIGSVCLSPRGDWRMPSDASFKLWIKEVESL